jgi:hypothetical protein
MRSIATGIGLSSGKDPKGNLAAPLTARVAFRANLHAHTTTARGRVNLIDRLTSTIGHRKGWDAVVAVLRDSSEGLSTRSDRDLLVAATLATSARATKRAIDREELRVSAEFLNTHLKRVNGRAAHTAEAVSVFEGLSKLVFTDEILELTLGFTAQALLHPAATGLANYIQ